MSWDLDEYREKDLNIIWKCDTCGVEHEEPPGYNEGGVCQCGGHFVDSGECHN